jgi:hypothetical protein
MAEILTWEQQDQIVAFNILHPTQRLLRCDVKLRKIGDDDGRNCSELAEF